MSLLCKASLHAWRDVGPPQAALDAAFERGGMAILGLAFMGGIYMRCERCGLENDALRDSGGTAARKKKDE
ncbi:MAG TPA: hypothetical protein VFA98_15555 [Thermoanaerobaculia bacterium]|nr:hypothetical protein [Thermoanaerobaculia bacterium]